MRLRGKYLFELIQGFSLINLIPHAEIDTDSHKVFHHLANNVPESTVIHCPGIDIHDQPDVPPADSTWVRHLYRDYRDIPTSELPKGASFGYTFTTCNVSMQSTRIPKSNCDGLLCNV